MIHNEDVAAAFEEMADLLSIRGENIFRIRAYQRAAQVIRSLPRPVADMHDVADIDALPGIGADLARKVLELVETGRLRSLEQARRTVPAGVRDLLGLPGLGPVRVRGLFTALNVRSLDDLKRVIEDGSLATVRGFGPKLRDRLAGALAQRASKMATRLARSVVKEYALPLKAFLESTPGVSRVELVGSYRRGRDTVADLDVLVCADAAATPLEGLRSYGDLREISALGRTKASGVLRNGLQVDIRVLGPASFGAAMHYFTGSRDHNIHVRRRAQELGFKLSEYGLFKGSARIAGGTEEELFRCLAMAWVPPELREDRGEVEAAERNALPDLIELTDLQGDLHVHTDASDGTASLAAMVEAAQQRGLRYIAITDHSKYIGIAHGLDAQRLSRQIDEIDALNARQSGVTVLKGAEVDILEDGSLALADSLLQRLDVVVIAIHNQFGLSRARQTSRLLRALERPAISIVAHPFGRLIGQRAGYELDFERILDAMGERKCCLEINSQPLRLDLDDVHARAACDRGVLLSIASDAHSIDQLGYLEEGVLQARRAWVTRQDVLNARPLDQLRTVLRGGPPSAPGIEGGCRGPAQGCIRIDQQPCRD